MAEDLMFIFDWLSNCILFVEDLQTGNFLLGLNGRLRDISHQTSPLSAYVIWFDGEANRFR
jgi:hypothetical protein